MASLVHQQQVGRAMPGARAKCVVTLQNTGATQWTDYRVVSKTEDGADAEQFPVPATPPGGEASVRVAVLAPPTSRVRHATSFTLTDASGTTVQVDGKDTFQVQILVTKRQFRAMARMLHPLNGRTMFDELQPSSKLEQQLASGELYVSVTPALLRAVADRAKELGAQGDGGLDTDAAAVQAAEEFGFTEPKQAVDMLRAV